MVRFALGGLRPATRARPVGARSYLRLARAWLYIVGQGRTIRAHAESHGGRVSTGSGEPSDVRPASPSFVDSDCDLRGLWLGRGGRGVELSRGHGP